VTSQNVLQSWPRPEVLRLKLWCSFCFCCRELHFSKGCIYFTWASWDILSIFKCCCVAVGSSFLWQCNGQLHLEWLVWRMLPGTISIGLCQFVLWHCCGWLWHKASKLQLGDEDIKALLVPAQDLDRVWTCDPLRYHRFPQISHFNGCIGAYCGILYSWTSIWWKCCLHVMANKVAQVEAGNQDPWDTACNWLLQSDHLWQDWLLAQRSSSCMQSHTYIHTASAPFLKSMMDIELFLLYSLLNVHIIQSSIIYTIIYVVFILYVFTFLHS